MNRFFFLFFLLLSGMVLSQNCIVEGRVFNALNNNSLDFAKVQVVSMQKGAITDAEGFFRIEGLEPGVYSFKAVFSGYQTLFLNEITVTRSRVTQLEFGMEELVLEQEEVVVVASPFVRKNESPVSLKTLNATEIERLRGKS